MNVPVLGCTTWCYRFGKVAQWVFLFDLSKLPEWIDTIFVVLRKKQLIFLHWYHHIITWLFCWYMNQYSHYYSCAGYYFASMNYAVHFFMYGYYGFTAMGFRPPIDFLITSMQIMQMVFGISILTYGMTCQKVDYVGSIFGLLMYLSFFALFVQLFATKYFGHSKKPLRSGESKSRSAVKESGNSTIQNQTNPPQHQQKHDESLKQEEPQKNQEQNRDEENAKESKKSGSKKRSKHD